MPDGVPDPIGPAPRPVVHAAANGQCEYPWVAIQLARLLVEIQ